MRSHIRAIVLLPTGNHNGNGAGNVNNTVIIIGQPTFHDFLAAISKSMDRYGFDNTVGPFSSTSPSPLQNKILWFVLSCDQNAVFLDTLAYEANTDALM